MMVHDVLLVHVVLLVHDVVYDESLVNDDELLLYVCGDCGCCNKGLLLMPWKKCMTRFRTCALV